MLVLGHETQVVMSFDSAAYINQEGPKGEEDIITSYGRQSGGRKLNEDVWVSDGIDHYFLGSNEVRLDLGSVLTPSNPGSCDGLRI